MSAKRVGKVLFLIGYCLD